MVTEDGLSLYLSRLLSRRKSSRSLLKQCETKICLGERFRRKRKFKFVLVLLAFVIGQSTVERTIWQKQRQVLSSTWHATLTLTMNGIETSLSPGTRSTSLLMDTIRQDTVMRKAVKVRKKIWPQLTDIGL